MPLRIPGGFQAVEADTRLMPFRVDSSASAQLAAIPGRQMEQLEQAVSSAGQAAMQIATDMQIEANRVAVTAAQNRARGIVNDLSFGEAGFYGIKGEAAVNPPDKVSMVDAYRQKLRTGLSEIHDSLGNDVQKQAFALWRDSLETEFTGQVSRHQLSEFKAHQVSTYRGEVELGLEAAAKSWSDPEKVRATIDGLPVPGDEKARYGGVRQAAYHLAKAQNKSESEATYEAKKAASGAHQAVIVEALAAKQYRYAHDYLSRNKEDMLESDVLKVSDNISRGIDASAAQMAVTAASRQMANRFQPTSMDRLQGVVLGLESGGKDFADDGKALTSPKGARYAMQVMPDTAKAPGFGIRPAADDSPAEYNRVGREYLGALVKKYGNVAQALGAYNAGPGALDEAVAKAKQDGRPESWGAYLPKETQDYIKKGLASYGAGEGAAPIPTELDFVQATLKALGPNASPEATKLARQEAEHQYGLITKALKAKDETAVAEGMRWLEANGGRFSEMPLALKSAIPAKEYDNLRSYGARVSKGDDISNMAVYQKLASEPAYLKALSDEAFYRLKGELSESDFKHFANERATLLKGGGSNSPQEINTEALNTVLADRLRSLGRDPTPKDGSGEAATMGEMRRFVRQGMLNQQAVTGKKMSDLEVEQFVDGLFAKSVTFRKTFLGFETGGKVSQSLMSMQFSDIPGDVRDRIKADFRDKGRPEPTDSQVLGIYWRLKHAGKL